MGTLGQALVAHLLLTTFEHRRGTKEQLERTEVTRKNIMSTETKLPNSAPLGPF